MAVARAAERYDAFTRRTRVQNIQRLRRLARVQLLLSTKLAEVREIADRRQGDHRLTGDRQVDNRRHGTTRMLHTGIWSTPSKARCSLQFHPHPLGEALEVLYFYRADAHGESLLANLQGDLRKNILEFR